MKSVVFMLAVILLLIPASYSNEWPLYNPALFTSPVPDPANSGNGSLESYKVAPNEKIIRESDPDEEWTVEFKNPNRLELTSSIDGAQGTFFNEQKCRSNNGRVVLTPLGPDNVIIENSPGDGDKFYFTVTSASSRIENFMTLFGDYNNNTFNQYWHGAVDIRVPGFPGGNADASVYLTW